MTTLHLKNLSRKVGNATLVRDVTLSFEAGSLNLLLGPNGAGKTSLLRLCALLDAPTGGTITTGNGKKPLEPAAAAITMVFQRPTIFSRSVLENLRYPLSLRGLPKAEQQSRIEEAVAVADLAGLTEQPGRSLSGGEAQRLALARAFVMRPRS